MDIEKIRLKKYLAKNLEVPKTPETIQKESSPIRGRFIAKILADEDLASFECCESGIDTYIDDNKKKELSFKQLLFKYIDRTDMLDSDVYTAGGIDRRLFSKIRNNDEYHPSKETVIQLGIGLKLNIDDLSSLLASASYTLSKNNYFDLIIRYCFENGIYNLIRINEFLYDYNCKLLGKDE